MKLIPKHSSGAILKSTRTACACMIFWGSRAPTWPTHFWYHFAYETLLFISDNVFSIRDKNWYSFDNFHLSANETFIMKTDVHRPTRFLQGKNSERPQLGLEEAARIPARVAVVGSLVRFPVSNFVLGAIVWTNLFSRLLILAVCLCWMMSRRRIILLQSLILAFCDVRRCRNGIFSRLSLFNR